MFLSGLQRAQTKQKASCTITSEEEAGPSGSGLKRKGDDKGGPCPKVKKHNEWYDTMEIGYCLILFKHFFMIILRNCNLINELTHVRFSYQSL